jgi:CBS domain-containing protein
MKVSEIMTSGIAVAHPRQTASQAAQIMEENDVGTLPVVKHDGRMVGIITDRDIALRCDAYGKDPLVVHVEEIMSEHVVSCHPDDDLTTAAKTMADHNIRRLPVLDRYDETLQGLLLVDDMVHIEEVAPLVDKILEQQHPHPQSA